MRDWVSLLGVVAAFWIVGNMLVTGEVIDRLGHDVAYTRDERPVLFFLGIIWWSLLGVICLREFNKKEDDEN